MKDTFFEGKDFQGDKFKALIPSYYPDKYKRYIAQETIFLKKKLKGANKVLEAGVGVGRLIPEVSPLVKEFVGIDVANLMLSESEKVAKKYKNVKIFKLNIEDVIKKFKPNDFNYSLCVWNTLGNLEDDVIALKALSSITKKSIIITVYKKGTLTDRIHWYDTVGIKIKKIDKQKEIFYSKSGLKSKSYSISDLRLIAKKANLKVKTFKTLSGVILLVELIK